MAGALSLALQSDCCSKGTPSAAGRVRSLQLGALCWPYWATHLPLQEALADPSGV